MAEAIAALEWAGATTDKATAKDADDTARCMAFVLVRLWRGQREIGQINDENSTLS